MSAFSFYAEPAVVIGEPQSAARHLCIGLGSDGPTETAFVGIADEGDWCSIQMTRDELRDVIDVLMETLGAMDAEATS